MTGDQVLTFTPRLSFIQQPRRDLAFLRPQKALLGFHIMINFGFLEMVISTKHKNKKVT